jgi:hypothetical protein
MTVTICVPICQILALMVLPCLQQRVLPVLTASPPWQVPSTIRPAQKFPLISKHRDNSTFIHRHYNKTNGTDTAEQGARRMRGTPTRSSLLHGVIPSDWLVSQRTDKVRRLIGHQHYTALSNCIC